MHISISDYNYYSFDQCIITVIYETYRYTAIQIIQVRTLKKYYSFCILQDLSTSYTVLQPFIGQVYLSVYHDRFSSTYSQCVYGAYIICANKKTLIIIIYFSCPQPSFWIIISKFLTSFPSFLISSRHQNYMRKLQIPLEVNCC